MQALYLLLLWMWTTVARKLGCVVKKNLTKKMGIESLTKFTQMPAGTISRRLARQYCKLSARCFTVARPSVGSFRSQAPTDETDLKAAEKRGTKRTLLDYSPKELAVLLDGTGRAKYVWDRIRCALRFLIDIFYSDSPYFASFCRDGLDPWYSGTDLSARTNNILRNIPLLSEEIEDEVRDIL
jgi:hypothetical protein